MHFIFYGLKRSGNHVIIHWLLRNVSKVIVEYMPSYIHRGNNIIFFNDVTNSAGAIQSEIDKKQMPSFVIASVEDKYEENLITNKIMIHPSKVFIIRDPMNCYASRVKSFDYLFPIEKFKQMYEDMLSSITEDSVVIYYNRWWMDKSYRDSIGERLGIPNINDILIRTKEGGGSGFTNEDYNNRMNDIIFDKKTQDILAQLKYQMILKIEKFNK
jgi:hypothetical protein